MYTLEFFVRQLDDLNYMADYKLYQNENILDEGVYAYTARTKPKHFNDAVMRVRWVLYSQLRRKYGGIQIVNKCTNPKEHFLSRSQMARMCNQRKTAEFLKKLDNQQPVLVSQPQKIEKKPAGERLYEVVEVGGIWTIKKHAAAWYTAEEAKTQLFAKIVNGD